MKKRQTILYKSKYLIGVLYQEKYKYNSKILDQWTKKKKNRIVLVIYITFFFVCVCIFVYNEFKILYNDL